ncbi:MAG: DUF2848 domain-containing protein [Candidimonas sp.]|nr:DUF2848 domain-containing protein [Candidimonas sp.]
MNLSFQLAAIGQPVAGDLTVDITNCIVAGWAGRDQAAIEHHIEELAELGVPRPSAVPLYYRIASNQLTQEHSVQVVGDGSSGEVEVFVFSDQGRMYVSLVSDHTDRKLESHSIALSKQLCVKPVGREAWRFDDVADHWDELVLRSWIKESGQTVLYQEGTLAELRHPQDLIQGYFGQDIIPEHSGMTCGTMGAIGGIRHAPSFMMELFDPRLQRSLKHRYTLEILPEVA